MLWACVLLPQLALDGVLRRHPAPDRPLVLLSGPAQRRVLHAANAAAAAYGLYAGQSVAAARALLADFDSIEYSAAEEAHHQSLLAAWAYGYSSQVSTAFEGAVLLEVEASLGLFGPWPRFAQRLREELTALGFSHRLAVAPTPQAARVLAAHEDGLAIRSEQRLADTLAALPVNRAGLHGDAGDRLHGMGLRTLGQVLALPREALARRFGPGLCDQLDRLQGRTVVPLPLYRPPDRFDVQLELGHEVESSQALLFPLRRLINDLAAYLSGRDGGVQQFEIRLQHEDHPDSVVSIGLLAAERDAGLLFDLSHSRLEQARMAAPARGLRLLAEALPPFVPAARELFDARPVQTVPWTALRERLRARLGDESVYALQPADDHRPEHALRRSTATTRPAAAARRTAAGTTGNAPVRSAPIAARPTWLLPRPIPLRDSAIRILRGPERLETGWWDGADVRRDYYIVETAAGQCAWVFCAPGEQGPFMLHGWFA